jgi:nucleotide-binding universal stress UspA family protein
MNSSNETNSESAFHSPSKILVTIDGSQNANRALSAAINIAKKFNSTLIILHVVAIPSALITSSAIGMPSDSVQSYYELQEADVKSYMDKGEADARAHGIVELKSEVIRANESVVEEIINFATDENVDLIVIGTRGLGGFKKLLQGSVSSGVVANAPCNVLVVR